MKVTILAGFAMCMILTSCNSSKTGPQSDVQKSIATHQIQFRMSNQSIQEPLAYVEIHLDGKQVFFGGLHVARQHNYFTFTTVSEEKPSSVTIKTTVDHAPPEGRSFKREISVDQDTPLNFDVDVHGTNIIVNQVKKFGLTS